MQTNHQDPLYEVPLRGSALDLAAEIRRIAALHLHTRTVPSSARHKIGRNRVTRAIDATLETIRKNLPPIHWLVVRLSAALLYGYARAVAATTAVVTVGAYRWPEFPKGSVLAIWHGSAPSLLAAFTKRRPSMPVKLMVSCDPRGDSVALFCRWLGFDIVRGDAANGGWKALIEIANEVRDGAAALISPDGGGPPFVASVGGAALASAVGVPLIPVGAYCHPSVFERHKWDHARNPLPYGRIAVACGEPLTFPLFDDAASLENARQQLQTALDRAAAEARGALGFNIMRFAAPRRVSHHAQ